MEEKNGFYRAVDKLMNAPVRGKAHLSVEEAYELLEVLRACSPLTLNYVRNVEAKQKGRV